MDTIDGGGGDNLLAVFSNDIFNSVLVSSSGSQLLLDLLADSPTSLLMVTHSPRVAARLHRRTVLHLGRLAAEGDR